MQKQIQRFLLIGALTGLLAGVGAVAQAKPVPPERVPVTRLVQNLTARVKKNPNDIQAVFTLGRVHYFAFAGSTDTINTIRNGGDRNSLTAPYDFFGERGKGRSAQATSTRPLKEAERLSHLKNAITYLIRAVKLNRERGGPSDGLYELCLACAFEDGASLASKVGSYAGIAATSKAWTDAARRYYGEAFDRAIDKDTETSRRPIFGVSTIVSYESGKSYQRLATLGGRVPTVAEKKRMASIDSFVVAMDKLPPGPVTPLVFSLERRASLPELLSDRVVRFDLNGSGLPQRYGWVRPDTAILVWDPDGTGRVTSGRQLFGSVTWWMFWNDAYQALAALDDDHDGWLSGRELTGLALWFDRNQNGGSEPGEVLPLARTSIVGIATKATGRTGDALMNPAGIRLKDGRTRPTYDWIAGPK
jgi:hypothetical protein